MLEKVFPELMVIGPLSLIASIVTAVFLDNVNEPFKDVLFLVWALGGSVGIAWLVTYIADKLTSWVIERSTKDP
ncbi:MAG: hypothetical protein JHC26_03730 [Thermofilum sp.]|uniref:hypothetical protein n=1 Tax=Thermofilum sp. TaxID=1961369 RepID=UPI00258D15E2|nr:hypothetical protein [Thermofilum sp.]MCI4408178.1 hypothetical protein [Thermofilum sp.]